MTGLRERKRLATRLALGLAALRLAIERGLDGVRVEDIAAAADVSPRTFNNYFANKYEAICALAVDRAEQMGAHLRARPADQPLWSAISAAVEAQFSIADTPPDREWIDGIRLITSAPELIGEHLKAQATMRHALAGAIAERLDVDPTVDMGPAIIAGAVTAAVDAATDRWLAADPPTALAPLIRDALIRLGELLPYREETQ